MSDCPYERGDLGLGMQIPEIPAQRKFVSAGCYAPSSAQNCGTYSFEARVKEF